MAYKIIQQEERTEWVQAEERLWLTADREKVVAEDDPEAAFLFATPSARISVEDAERYGLIKSGKASKPAAETEAPDEPAPKKSAKKK